MQSAEVLCQSAPIDEALPFAFDDEDDGMAAFSPSHCSRAAAGVDLDGFGSVEVWLHATFVALEGALDFQWEERWMDVVESFQQLEQHVVSFRPHGFRQLGLVLRECLPCHARRLARWELWQKLIFAEQGREVQQVVGVAGRAGEVGG